MVEQRRSDSMEPRTFIVLDGLRGMAALAIVARHAPFFIDPALVPQKSYLAVDFFFALSGFVLQHAYGQRLSDKMSGWTFLKTRMIRLYPLYFLSLLLTLPVDRILNGVDADLATAMIAGFLLLPSPATEYDLLFPFTLVAWSLFFELIANAAYGFFAWRLGARWIAILVAGAGAFLVFGVLTRHFGFVGNANAGWTWPSIGAGLIRVTFSFYAGVLLYRIRPALGAIPSIPVVIIFVVMAGVLIAHPPDEFGAAFDLAVTVLVFPILILVGAAARVDGLTARIFLALGRASYAIYILQIPIYNWMHKGFQNLPVQQSGLISAIGFSALVWVVALAADQYFDSPVRKWLGVKLNPAPGGEHAATDRNNAGNCAASPAASPGRQAC